MAVLSALTTGLRRVLLSRVSVLVGLLLLLALRIADPGPLQALRLHVFDAFQQLAPRSDARSPVVIVDIDEASLAALGQWP